MQLPFCLTTIFLYGTVVNVSILDRFDDHDFVTNRKEG